MTRDRDWVTKAEFIESMEKVFQNIPLKQIDRQSKSGYTEIDRCNYDLASLVTAVKKLQNRVNLYSEAPEFESLPGDLIRLDDWLEEAIRDCDRSEIGMHGIIISARRIITLIKMIQQMKIEAVPRWIPIEEAPPQKLLLLKHSYRDVIGKWVYSIHEGWFNPETKEWNTDTQFKLNITHFCYPPED